MFYVLKKVGNLLSKTLLGKLGLIDEDFPAALDYQESTQNMRGPPVNGPEVGGGSKRDKLPRFRHPLQLGAVATVLKPQVRQPEGQCEPDSLLPC